VSDRGTIAILLSTYLSIILLSIFGFASVGVAVLAGHRIQGVADFSVIYGHDRAVRAGKPSPSRLEAEIRAYLRQSPAASRLLIQSVDSWVISDNSNVRICARYQDLFGLRISSMTICRQAAAKSFLLP
jgi:hypothetical protein